MSRFVYAGELPKKTGTDRRRDALREMERFICQDRQGSYGDAEDSFADIAAIASVVLARKLNGALNALDVAIFMDCVKLGRIARNPTHLDSHLDLGGYAGCAAGIIMAQKERIAPNVH